MLKNLICVACGKPIDGLQKFANYHNDCRQLPAMKRSEFKMVKKPFQK